MSKRRLASGLGRMPWPLVIVLCILVYPIVRIVSVAAAAESGAPWWVIAVLVAVPVLVILLVVAAWFVGRGKGKEKEL